MKKLVTLILVLALMCTLSFSAYAQTEKNSSEPMVISTTAAVNGVYQYNVKSKQETFLPSSTYKKSSINSYPQYSPSNIGSDMADPYTVTNPDGRWKITNSSGRYTNTVLLKIKFPGSGETWATGWMIGPKTIATAGHCVFDYNYGWAEYIIAYPGSTGGSKPVGSATSKNMWAGRDYVANQGNYNLGIHDDWGVIEVDSNIGNNTGWLGLVTASNYSDISGKTFQTNGYPSDLDNQSQSIDNKWMYSTYGKFTGTKPRFLPTMYIDMDFASGQSGSAIYRHFENTGYSAQAIGVGGNGKTIAVLINNWLFDFFMSVR